MRCSSRAQEFHDNLDGCAHRLVFRATALTLRAGLHSQPLMSRFDVGRDCLGTSLCAPNRLGNREYRCTKN